MNPARRIPLVAVLALALVAAAATPAIAKPVKADERGYIAMYQGACHTTRGWQADANRNGVYARNGWMIYANRYYDVDCPNVSTNAPRKPAPKKPPAGSTSKRAKVLAFARAQIGEWYLWGAAGPNRWDCSGLVLGAYKRIGIYLPHKANLQQRRGRAVSRANARAGDLVFFRYRSGYAYHVGIYAGNGYVIDAPGRGRQVGKRKIWSGARVVFRRLVA